MESTPYRRKKSFDWVNRAEHGTESAQERQKKHKAIPFATLKVTKRKDMRIKTGEKITEFTNKKYEKLEQINPEIQKLVNEWDNRYTTSDIYRVTFEGGLIMEVVGPPGGLPQKLLAEISWEEYSIDLPMPTWTCKYQGSGGRFHGVWIVEHPDQ